MSVPSKIALSPRPLLSTTVPYLAAMCLTLNFRIQVFSLMDRKSEGEFRAHLSHSSTQCSHQPGDIYTSIYFVETESTRDLW